MIAFTFGCQCFAIAVLSQKNPELLNERGKGIKKDTKPFDRWFFRTYVPMVYIMMIVAALDCARFGWSSMPLAVTMLAYPVAFGFYLFAYWAMLMNTHFETTVRIQHDRNQTVITTGPYAVVRHPGYLAGVTVLLLIPLMLGSLWALIPAGLAVAIMMTRTALEDNTLRVELEGYPEYAQRVLYRLFPGIW